MAPNFDQQISNITTQINSFIRNKRPIPNKLLDYYNTLLSTKSLLDLNTLNSSESLYRFSFSNFANQQIIAPNSSINFIVLQNNGNDTIYFSPFITGDSDTYTSLNAFVLIAGASWSSDRPQFIKQGIKATSNTQVGSLLVGYYSTI